MSGVVGRLDAELVRRGMARSRTRAAGLIRAGRVWVDGVIVTKPAAPLAPDQHVSVEEDDEGAYVSRAALKLAGVLDALGQRGPVIEGADCLDVGASTGGFTDVLLRRGARRVLAVDVGHDQLVAELRADPRVDVREGLNARDLDRSHVPTPPDLVVADLSFISLRTVLPALARVTGAGTQLLVMVKPQFEVGRERLGRGGVVRSGELRAGAVADVAEAADGVGLAARAVIPSPLPGPSGNREYFLWLRPATREPRDGDLGGGDPRTARTAAANAAAWEAGIGPVPVYWINAATGGRA